MSNESGGFYGSDSADVGLNYNKTVFRCGWCGAPTDEGGVELQGKEYSLAIKNIQDDSFIDTKVVGECCQHQQENHDNYEH